MPPTAADSFPERRDSDRYLSAEACSFGKIESRIAAFLNPKAFHSAFPRHDVDANSIGQIKHRIVSVHVIQQAAGITFRPEGHHEYGHQRERRRAPSPPALRPMTVPSEMA